MPTARAPAVKMWMRISSFAREALPIIIGIILTVNVLYQLNVSTYLAGFAERVITGLWG